MQLRFIHSADIHLGYEQYNLVQRANDFARAYLAVVEYAIEAHADFVLIAGDLFHRASADAWMLKQAKSGLDSLHEAGIPVIAVEGNHDAQNVHKNLSWLEFLCHEDLLYLLNVQNQNGYRSLVPFDPQTGMGSYVDLAGARIYGMKYHGATTARRLEEIRDQIEPGAHGYTILMLHGGLEGQVPHLHGGLTRGQIEPLREQIDYLALGHIHKRLMDEWIFNPGSTEINSVEEMEWPHGFFDVRVNTSLPGKHTVTAIPTPDLRAFRRITVSAEGIGSLHEFVAHAEETIAAEPAMPDRAVVELYLGGVAEFRRQDVPMERLKSAVDVRFSPLVTRVRNTLVPPGVVTVRNQDRLSRVDLERQVVEHLVYQQAEYRDRAASWARLILDVKNMAAEKTLPASIADHVRAALAEFEAPAEPGEADSLAPQEASSSADSDTPGAIPGLVPETAGIQPELTPAEHPSPVLEGSVRTGRTFAGEASNGSGLEANGQLQPKESEAPLSIAGEPIDADFELEESW